jgi:hypothetical protein
MWFGEGAKERLNTVFFERSKIMESPNREKVN